MLHEPASYSGKDPSSEIKKKIGIRMFIAYGIVYAGFVLINTLAPQLMGRKILLGLNLAVTYGFGLIVLAIVSGMLYNRFCTKKEDEMAEGEDE